LLEAIIKNFLAYVEDDKKIGLVPVVTDFFRALAYIAQCEADRTLGSRFTHASDTLLLGLAKYVDLGKIYQDFSGEIAALHNEIRDQTASPTASQSQTKPTAPSSAIPVAAAQKPPDASTALESPDTTTASSTASSTAIPSAIPVANLSESTEGASTEKSLDESDPAGMKAPDDVPQSTGTTVTPS
jgi:hypothetical protein